MESIRLDKLLADAGYGTRSQVKALLRKGRVTVDGDTVKKPEQKVDPAAASVCVDGSPVLWQKYTCYMFHKPQGCVTATRDAKERTVMDFFRIPKKEDFFPVGRLDKDTEGLLLVTNDGALAHELLSPVKHVDKTYYARVKGVLRQEHIQAFRDGLPMGEEKRALPAVLKILSAGEISEAEVTVQEGRFHQVKRMFAAVGCEVIYLKRISMGGLALDPDLPKGSYRMLDDEEMRRLRQ